MENTVREAVKCWTDRPTSFSPHPMDAKELRRAVANLKNISPTPTFDEIKEAILFYVVDTPMMPGTPKDIYQVAHDFTGKIYKKI